MSAGEALSVWTVYDSPLDYPGKFVVRRWRVTGAGHVMPDQRATSHDSLEEARQAVPPGLFRMGRGPADDPAVLEVWI